MNEAIRAIQDLLDPDDWSDRPEDIERCCVDHRREYHGSAALLVRPRTTDHVAKIVAICRRSAIGIVPQGGNTGLTGASVPRESGREILLHLGRMNRIRNIDTDNGVMTVEAGCVLADVQAGARRAGYLFPLDLASRDSCRIGGNIATNAGGINVLRYGMTRGLVLGLEVVLANGRVLDTLSALIKDNSGYDLKQLFIGSEGTLGIITAASLRLSPIPKSRVVAMTGIDSPQQGSALLRQMRAAGLPLQAFEYIPLAALELVLSHIEGTQDPFPRPSPAYLLIEARGHGPRPPLERQIKDILTAAGHTSARIASTADQERRLWTLREAISEAERREGGSIKHDIAVPPAALPAFLDQAAPMIRHILPQARIIAFGHFGDGNLHYNLQRPKDMEEDTFLSYRPRFGRVVYDLTVRMGGSISAEHGIGQLRRQDLLRYKSPTAIDLMRRIKHALDPHNILNPGKVLPEK